MKTTLKVLFLSTALGALAFPALAEDLVVGLATAQTGGLAPYDQPSLKGLQMAVDEINAAGGIAGKFPIKLVAKDTRSDAAQTALVAQELVDGVVDAVARRRGVSPEVVWEAVNASPVTPDDALRLGLIDRVGYRDEAYAATLAEWGAAPESLLFAHRYTSRSQLAKRFKPGGDKVAVVTLRGAIVTGRGGASPLGGQSAGSGV